MAAKQSKDVKTVQSGSTVFQKGVSGSSTPSKPFVSAEDKYVLVQKSALSKYLASISPPPLPNLLSTDPDAKSDDSTDSNKSSSSSGSAKSSGSAIAAVCRDKTKLDYLTKLTGKSQEEVTRKLKEEYLAAIGDLDSGALNSMKHAYIYKEDIEASTSVGTANTPTTSYNLSYVNQGTNVNNRLANKIFATHIEIKVRVETVWVKQDIAVTTNHPYPTMWMYLYRNKINVNPVSQTTINYALGQNPPSTENVLYNGLGLSYYLHELGVRDPSTGATHEVYLKERFCSQPEGQPPLSTLQPTAAANRGLILPFPNVQVREFLVPIYKNIEWEDDSEPDPQINAIWISFEKDFDLAACQMRFSMSSRLIFRDATD